MSEINVVQRTQRIVVDPFSSAVAIINAGPQGPKGANGSIGPPGPGTPNEYLRADGTVPATGALVVPNPTLDTHALNRLFADGRYLAAATKYAKGQVAYAQVVANVTLNTAALTDIAGLSITYAVEANRRYRVKAKVIGQGTVIGDCIRWAMLEGTTVIDQGTSYATEAARQITTQIMEKSYNAGIAAGSKTFKVQAYRLAGTGAPILAAGATYPSFIELEDIGPV